MSAQAKLRTYIMENYLFTDDDSALNNNDSFLSEGILDSTGIMEVIFFIEEEFSVAVADEEMIPENMDSIDNILAFIQRKQAA